MKVSRELEAACLALAAKPAQPVRAETPMVLATDQSFRLPWPPSLNHLWRHVGNKVLLSAAGRQHRKDVAGALTEQHVRPMTGRLGVCILAWPRSLRVIDLDNVLKATLDCMQAAGLYENDGQIDDLRIIRMEPCRPCGKLDVRVRQLDAEATP